VLMAVCLAGPRTPRSKWKRLPSPRSTCIVPEQFPFTAYVPVNVPRKLPPFGSRCRVGERAENDDSLSVICDQAGLGEWHKSRRADGELLPSAHRFPSITRLSIWRRED
jgi:hypothetical protein